MKAVANLERRVAELEQENTIKEEKAQDACSNVGNLQGQLAVRQSEIDELKKVTSVTCFSCKNAFFKDFCVVFRYWVCTMLKSACLGLQECSKVRVWFVCMHAYMYDLDNPTQAPITLWSYNALGSVVALRVSYSGSCWRAVETLCHIW